MQIKVEKKVCVITPTVGSKHVKLCAESVSLQTYSNIEHLLVVDGRIDNPNEFGAAQILYDFKVTQTPYNTGANGFYGHRIYAAYPHLVDADYIFFLDEDNYLEVNHVESMVDVLDHYGPNIDFVHSLRNIVQPNAEFVAPDCCESTGRYPIFFTLDKPEKMYLIDTSTYGFRREWLINHCQNWHWGWGGDRRFFEIVMKHAHYATTGLHTLNYRLDDRMEAKYGSLDFFHKGNEVVKQHYGGKYPWQET
jgi:glycosyltransferase involved in cell wall biosynthesis